MPQKDSTKAQIEKLTKELNLTRGALHDKDIRISDLEKRVLCNGCHPKPCFGCIRERETCKHRPYAKGDHSCRYFEGRKSEEAATVKENTDLKEALAALQVELNNERDIKFGLIEAIRERERKNSVLQGQFDHMVKITEEINSQREALRAALKAVL